jgi:hypothetical protein
VRFDNINQQKQVFHRWEKLIFLVIPIQVHRHDNENHWKGNEIGSPSDNIVY